MTGSGTGGGWRRGHIIKYYKKEREDQNMKKIDWTRKLTSRKFWAAVVGFVTPIMTIAQVPDNTAVQITAIIMAGGTLIAYIIGEGLTDAAAAESRGGKDE